VIENLEDVPSYVRPEIAASERRTREAGGEGPLQYVGAGMFGIVFCDAWRTAWKAFRYEEGKLEHLKFLRGVLEEEYEWLRDAAGTSIASNVAQVTAMHPEQLVLERECVQGRPGGWAEGKRLAELHTKISKVMELQGWGAPEFKEDSYIIEKTGTPRLVDISLTSRLGMTLARYAEDVLSGRRESADSWNDLAFFIIREIPYKTIPDEIARDLVQRLVQRDPTIAKRFVLPRGWRTLE
jgi:hypothetical protein